MYKGEIYRDSNKLLGREMKSLQNSASSFFIDTLYSPSRVVLIILDLLISIVSFVLAVWVSPYGQFGELTNPIVFCCLSFAFSFIMLAMGMGFYERTRRFKPYKNITISLMAAVLATPFSLATVYFAYYEVFGRLTFLYGTIGAYLGVTLFRTFLTIVYRFVPYRFSMLGKCEIGEKFVNVIMKHDAKNFHDIRYMESTPSDFSASQDYARSLRRNGVLDLIVSEDTFKEPGNLEVGLHAIEQKIRLIDEVEFYSSMTESLPVDHISKLWLLNSVANQRRVLNSFLKRSMDIVASFCGLIILSPVFLLISLGIKLTSKGPVFFLQPRQGRYMTSFNMLKFRTMKIEESREDASGGFTQKGDSRVTGIGRIIRPLHLDELPQLWNIFCGQMSIVGPRPEALKFAQNMSRIIDVYEMRYLIRPGLTGHAQIMAGYMMDNVDDTKKKLCFDLYYLVNHNVFLDMRTIVRTIFIVLKQTLKG